MYIFLTNEGVYMKRILLSALFLVASLNAVTIENPNLFVTNNTNSDLNVRVKIEVELQDNSKLKGSAHAFAPALACVNLSLASFTKQKELMNLSDLNAKSVKVIKVRARNADRSFTGGIKARSKGAKSTPVNSGLENATFLELNELNSKVQISFN